MLLYILFTLMCFFILSVTGFASPFLLAFFVELYVPVEAPEQVTKALDLSMSSSSREVLASVVVLLAISSSWFLLQKEFNL